MPSARFRIIIIAICFLIVCLVCARGTAQSVASGEYGSWMRLPQAEWPSIAVVNQIEFVDQHHPVAGCGFLLQVEDEVLAVTAKHVLTYFKSPQMDSVAFKGTLKSWKMFPKDHPHELVVVDTLLNQDPREPLVGIPCDRDWLLFTIRYRSEQIQALRLRTTPLVEGEPVHVIGWRYTDEGCPQIVYDGKYVRSERGAVLITVEKLVNNKIPGLSGAPVIDNLGYLIGIMSRGRGEIQRLSSVEYPRKVLQARSHPGSRPRLQAK